MEKKPEKVPPEGGWGYLITLAVFIAHFTTVVPLASFGIIHGQFLASLGDETAGTSISTSLFIAFTSCSGLFGGILFNKYSYRTVGLLGAVCHLTGSILLLFADTLFQFIICISVIQGMAGGFLLPSAFSSLNEYFHKKLSLQTAIAQILITVATVVNPLAMEYCVQSYGYKTTKIVLIGYSCLNFFGMWSLHPVEWHTTAKKEQVTSDHKIITSHAERGALLGGEKEVDHAKLDKERQIEESTSTYMSYFDLLKSAKYLNIAIGTSLTFHSDNLFIGMLASVLRSINYSSIDIAKLTMVHFGCDLVTRIIYAILSAFYSFNNRYLVYGSTIFTAIFRILFIINDGYAWRMGILVILGILRTFIQTPYSLVIAEAYRDNFSRAFTLFCVLSGLTSILLGPLMNLLKGLTNNDNIAVQVLTGAMLLSALMWTVEFVYIKLSQKNKATQRKS
ncbi:monocarboxylate transporter 1-like isoform X2 [Diabrotica undecimpunctata]|uniref:monocarboxylate transporter 1-like isoform X2 n=1 Tax=Diabrotica undecimpunctata TaxID=50387 RepID=UPI003B638E8C